VIQEIKRDVPSGYTALAALLLLTALLVFGFYRAIQAESAPQIVTLVLLAIVLFVLWFGFFLVNPNEARVLLLFGKYVGSVKTTGLKYSNPLYTKKRVSLRTRNFETGRLKVNDRDSNPIEIAAVVVWKVVDSAEALFEVDDFVQYVTVQSEAAVRTLASQYPYDVHEEGVIALASHQDEISDKMLEEIQARLAKAGVHVIEARISHLAYAPEIASAMLQRQQASAIIAARQKIVEGAVGMVDMALEHLERDNIVALDDERKAAMVSNLLVVLCADRAPQPVVNAGSLYQ
jgi:regulator of protease activity HflC (stomatin/prohibitin superfamily)